MFPRQIPTSAVWKPLVPGVPVGQVQGAASVWLGGIPLLLGHKVGGCWDSLPRGQVFSVFLHGPSFLKQIYLSETI